MDFHIWLSSIKGIAIAIVGAFFIIVATICVGELSARISARLFISTKIDRLEKTISSQDISNEYVNSLKKYRAELRKFSIVLEDIGILELTGAEQTRHTIHAIRYRITEGTQIESTDLQIEAQRSRAEKLKRQLDGFEEEGFRLSSRLTSLEERLQEEIYLGGTKEAGFITPPGDGPVANSIRENIGELKSSKLANYARISSINSSIEASQKEIEAIINGKPQWSPSFYVKNNPILHIQSDFIMSILIIICGGIGAIFTASREKKIRFFKTVFNGLMAGFIVFLVLKGGRFLFFIEAGNSQAGFINPYAAAFAGVLSGLFTEKAYNVLSEFADQIGAKLAREHGS